MDLNILENIGSINIPKVLIGGINLQNLEKLLEYDFDCVALSQAIFKAQYRTRIKRFFYF